MCPTFSPQNAGLFSPVPTSNNEHGPEKQADKAYKGQHEGEKHGDHEEQHRDQDERRDLVEEQDHGEVIKIRTEPAAPPQRPPSAPIPGRAYSPPAGPPRRPGRPPAGPAGRRGPAGDSDGRDPALLPPVAG